MKSIINLFFDKVCVITCDSFVERHDYISKHFLLKNIEFEFFVSINNKLLIETDISNTEKSLSVSHLNCVINAKLNKYNSILICEDDVNFIENIEYEFINFIEKLPSDWNFLQIGNQFWADKWLRREYINKNLYKFKWGTGSHCIGINSNSYDILIDRFKILDMPVDFMYYDLYSKMNCYSPEHFLADALSKNNHLEYYSKKHIFNSTIFHKNI